ncbi:Uncharacterized protein APZ42_021883 [Daphnia magna]|uniref:Uncharacterized protein n=1 Tax=Daphnia magna TaxID=35525 RepID=A0A164W988_9CRUS|nr:Uncharacterized protein APZ42_021883 [Daphnia magna]
MSLALFSILLATALAGANGFSPSSLSFFNCLSSSSFVSIESLDRFLRSDLGSVFPGSKNSAVFGVSYPLVLSESDESARNENKNQINRFPLGRIIVLIRTANLSQILTEFRERLFSLFTGFKAAEYRKRDLL